MSFSETTERMEAVKRKPLESYSTTFILNIPIFIVIIILGIIGNINLLLISRRGRKIVQIPYLILKWMAISNILLCITYTLNPISHYILNMRRDEMVCQYYWNIYVGKVNIVFNSTFKKTSFLLTLLLAIDRYLALCRPFMYRTELNVKKIKLSIFLCYLISIILSFPVYIRNVVVEVSTVNSSTCLLIEDTDYACCSTRFTFKRNPAIDEYISFKYYEIIKELTLLALPMITILYMNFQIVMVYKAKNKIKDTMMRQNAKSTTHNNPPMNEIAGRRRNNSKSSDKQLTLTMIVTSLLMIITLLPMSFKRILIIVRFDDSIGISFVVANLIESLNFCLNFYIFLLLNHDIRELCKKLYLPIFEKIGIRNFHILDKH
ncbi:unnamed protein product [Gordionus sp. m RMFG-2023]|uniref:probable G-protein coupled receptor AH9.1 n=1 Tax=Gordionus sp. m RMFG-2023 TaxID=3053472 RepID=UPI0030DF9B89